MRFDSAEFLFFFLTVLLLHRTLPWKRALLVVASYAFYASWNPPFLLLLVASSLLDYAVAHRIEDTSSIGRKRVLLGLSLAGNLGVLAYFKYINFALDTLVDVGVAGHDVLAPFYVHAAIPLGISFYTFQTLSYSIDVYRGGTRACRDPMDFALFVAFFPQLIAGPILKADEFLPQLRDHRGADHSQIVEGLELCLVGLFKKAVVADTFALLVDDCFSHPGHYSGAALLIGTFAFSAQIFCDFSGYSTMARGLALLLGFHLPENFGFPFLAGNPIQYRRDWHITMGRWFRDYVYRPLGGDRRGTGRMVLNTLVTWTGFGLWHGANWTFVLWGLFNGVLLVGYRLMRAWRLTPGAGVAPLVIGHATMPVTLALLNIMFRSPDVATAETVLSRILTWAPGWQVHPVWALMLAGLVAVHWANRRWSTEGFLVGMAWPARLTWVAGMVGALMLMAGSGQPFYYFQF